MEQTFESILQELLSGYDRTKGISVDEFLRKNAGITSENGRNDAK